MSRTGRHNVHRWLSALAAALCCVQAVWSVPLLLGRARTPGVPFSELVMIGAGGVLFLIAAAALVAYSVRRPPVSRIDAAALEQMMRLEQRAAERLAGQLHAGPVQSLIAAGLLAQTGDSVEDELEAIAEQLRAAEREVRDVMAETRPPQIGTAGFGPVCQHLDDLLDARDGVQIVWDWHLDSRDAMPELTADLAYRVLHETLDNVAKHSGCDTAFVHVELNGEGLVVSVRDEGTGFMPPPLHERAASTEYRTSGLHMLSARATVLGARMSLTTGPELGTTVTLVAPIDDLDVTMVQIGPAPISAQVSA